MEMPTGYDLLEHSHEFRMHMLRRLAAALIDVCALFIPITIIIFLLNVEPIELFIGILTGFAFFSYSAILESLTGTTLGKKSLGLFVASIDGPMTLRKGLIRSVPKMFWYFFLLIDILIGLGLKGDPRQRWTDRVANTIVIKK